MEAFADATSGRGKLLSLPAQWIWYSSRSQASLIREQRRFMECTADFQWHVRLELRRRRPHGATRRPPCYAPSHWARGLRGHVTEEKHPSTFEERVLLSYNRARAIARCYAIDLADIIELNEKFWDIHSDPIAAVDGAAATLLSIHYNLFVGTLAPYAETSPELDSLIKEALAFNVLGQFYLTEVGHGLDAIHIETTATQLANGDYQLHTPNAGAAKFMPPASPMGQMRQVGIVFARLMVQGEYRGIRGFVVPITNTDSMCMGVTTRILPQRSGSKALDHGITSFDHVRIASWALLGNHEHPGNIRLDLQRRLWRVGIGTMALSFLTIPGLSVSTLIAGTYSLRRQVLSADDRAVPIMSFRTQQLPILHAIAQVSVMRALRDSVIPLLRNAELEFRVIHGICTAVKAVMNQHCQSSLYQLAERSGAQGLFGYNQIITIQAQLRGVCIAEGDILVLSIRLASEVLREKYELPPSEFPESLVVTHEKGIISEARQILSRLGKRHRGRDFNELILPRCRQIVESIGHRMAYDAARRAGIHPALLSLYETHIASLDAGWYIEHGHLTRQRLVDLETSAASLAMEDVEQLLHDVACREYAVAPIVSEGAWAEFVNGLPVFRGLSSPQDPTIRARL